MSFTIESNVPTVSGRRGRKPSDFPFADMSVGDSFLIACDTAEKKVVDSWRRKLFNARKRFQESYDNADGIKFQTATVDGGLRVWRTE
jgi:hypothetical protein